MPVIEETHLKYLVAVGLVLSVLALIAGCGGGGGGGGSNGSNGSNGTTSGGTLTSYRVTGVFQANQSLMVDLGTVFVGDQVQLEITARNSSGALVTVPASGWSTTAPSGVATLTSSGLLTAISPSGGNNYLISVTVGGKSYSSQVVIVAVQDVVTGNVQTAVGGPVESCAVMFYDNGGDLLSTTYSTRNGNFRASVPGSATRFTINTTPGEAVRELRSGS